MSAISENSPDAVNRSTQKGQSSCGSHNIKSSYEAILTPTEQSSHVVCKPVDSRKAEIQNAQQAKLRESVELLKLLKAPKSDDVIAQDVFSKVDMIEKDLTKKNKVNLASEFMELSFNPKLSDFVIIQGIKNANDIIVQQCSANNSNIGVAIDNLSVLLKGYKQRPEVLKQVLTSLDQILKELPKFKPLPKFIEPLGSIDKQDFGSVVNQSLEMVDEILKNVALSSDQLVALDNVLLDFLKTEKLPPDVIQQVQSRLNNIRERLSALEK